MGAPPSGVRIRMYNPGFGDCFLLGFAGESGEPVYVMIDCGVHGSYKGGSVRIRNVLSDIRTACNGRLDLVVVTHEHADHVSGFYLGRKIFDGDGDPKQGIVVDRAWFGWTEQPGNQTAERLDKALHLMLQGLVGAHQSLAASEAEKLESMLGFYASEAYGSDDLDGLDGSDGSLLPLGGRGKRTLFGVSTRKSRDQIRDHAGEVDYLKPKRKPLDIPGVAGVRVFVLGPPEDERALLSPNPTGQAGEVYEGDEGHHLYLESDKALVAAMAAAGKVPSGLGDAPWQGDYRPFASNHGVAWEVAKARKDLYPFFQQRYGFGHNHKEAWRRIDDDWLNPAESLALKLDSATNNTSLVLAIELPKSRRVLLFPGDAQVGNWLSWHQGGWSEKNGLAKDEEITAEDLLARTVLYKVGHHGSHNATLQDKGLKLMVSDELVALIPVDQEWALARRPHAWNMPFPPMYEDLLQRTRGRILRTDHGIVPGAKKAWRRFPGKEPELKLGNDGEPLYTELEIPDD